MEKRVFEKLESVRKHTDIIKYRDCVLQILLFKYISEVFIEILLKGVKDYCSF